MNRRPLSFREKLQLLLIRWLSVALRAVDSLFGIHWGGRLLERLSGRWQDRMAGIDRDLARLEAERERLHLQTEALAIHSAVIYLGGRSLTRGELRFDPAEPHDEELLSAAIDLLVKRRLAAIRSEQVAPEHYIYHLQPDWAAIHARLARAADQAEPEVASWFREGLGFVDTLASSETDAPLG